jgi:outer membrane protein insertion porin family
MIVLALLAFQVSTEQPAIPPRLPPAGSPELVRTVEIAFPTQGNTSLVEPSTYLYYIHTRPSRPSQNEWTPYDAQVPLEDFRRLWATGFLDNLRVDVTDEPYSNGVIGKHVTFNLEERQRVKIVDYTGSKAVETSKIEEKLKDAGTDIRLDTFIDAGVVRKVEGIVRQLLQEKGFQSANVTHTIQEMPGGPKLVHLTFHLDEGPKVRIRNVSFVGNHSVTSRTLRRQLKENKARPWWIPPLLPAWLLGGSAFQDGKFDEDADHILQYYRDRG